MIGRAVRSGVRVVKDIVELVDLEARGVQDVSALVRAVPMVPLRVAVVVRDVVIVLAEMPTREAEALAGISRALRGRPRREHPASLRRICTWTGTCTRGVGRVTLREQTRLCSRSPG